MNSPIVVVATVSLVIGASAVGGAWYLQSSTSVDVVIETEPTATPAPAAVATPAPRALPQTVADIIPGYEVMTDAEKKKAIREALQNLGIDDERSHRILAKASEEFFFDGDKYKGVRFDGVLPDGWVE